MKKYINIKSFIRQLALMFGFTIFFASVMAGANIADKMEQLKGILVIILGNLFLAIYSSIIAYISNKKQWNLDNMLKKSFGSKGAIVPSMIMVLTQIGWIGVGFAMIAIPISKTIGISPWWIVFPIAIIIISTAYFGIKSLTIISMIAVPLIVILGIVTIIISTTKHPYQTSWSNQLNIFWGISLVIGTFISGATFSPNFAIQAKNPKHAWITTFLAFLIGNGFMIGIGFTASLFDDSKIVDFVGISQKSGFMWLGLIILIMNIWTTNDSGLYSVALGFKNWFNLKKKFCVIIFGLISASLSILLFKNFIWFLYMMNSFAPAIGALMIMNFFWKRKKILFYWKKFDWVIIIIWIVSSTITFIPIFKPFAPIVAFSSRICISSLWFIVENKINSFKKFKLNIKGEKNNDF